MNRTAIAPQTGLARAVGAAFFLQAATSLLSGAVFLNPLVDAPNIETTLRNFASHTGLVRAGILGDMLTAMGIVALGALLYAVAGHVNRTAARIALALYVLEAGLLAASKLVVFVLLRISQAYSVSGDPSLATMAGLALDTKDFIYKMHMLPFGFGAFLFYLLLHRAGAMPKWLSLWGLLAVPFVLIGAAASAAGIPVPAGFLALALPYAPFEFVAGIYLCARGFSIPSGRS